VPEVVDAEARLPSVRARPLECPRPIGLRWAAADPGAEEQLVITQVVLVDPRPQQLDEPGRNGDGAVAGLGVSWLVPVDVRLGHGDRPPSLCGQAEGTRAEHDDLRGT
jgi:hypothetical protein